MKINFKILIIIAVVTLFSCSNSMIKKSSQNNFEIVDLPDGSVAYLNSNSSIEYDKNFDKRVVMQKGEVFFSVTKGDSPFVVKTEVGEIQVLGTKFNVNSNNKELEVEVEEGTVELKINKFVKKVKKGQKAFFKRNKNGIKIGKAKFEHKKWITKLNKELKQLGKELKKSSKQVEKESKKIGKEVKQGFLKFKKDLQ